MDIWEHEETRDCEYARASVGDFRIEVTDFDGDLSEWTISYKGHIVANGWAEIWNHFEACKAAAWATVHSFETVPSGYMMTLSELSGEATE
jgi:hypothetical protein